MQVTWTKPRKEERIEQKPEPGTYNPSHSLTLSEAPRISFSTTPRNTNLSGPQTETPAPLSFDIPYVPHTYSFYVQIPLVLLLSHVRACSLTLPSTHTPSHLLSIPHTNSHTYCSSLPKAPRGVFGKADRTHESIKVFQGKAFMKYTAGIESPGPAWGENIPSRISDPTPPRAVIGKAHRYSMDKQYTGGGSNYINDGGVTMKSLDNLGPGAYDVAHSTLTPRGVSMPKSERRTFTVSAMPGPGSYTPTAQSVYDRPGASMAGAPALKSAMADVPGLFQSPPSPPHSLSISRFSPPQTSLPCPESLSSSHHLATDHTSALSRSAV
jgi:hypothetical protein